MADVVHFRFRLRGGTAAEWTAANPVLLPREPGVETDTAKLKLGDGTTSWNALPYAGHTDISALNTEITGLTNRVNVLETTGGTGGGGSTGSVGNLEPDPNDPGTFIVTAGTGTSAPSATLVNTPFAVRWSTTTSTWEYATLTAAKNAGFDERQTVWFLGNPTGSLPGWARAGDVWTQE